MGGVIWAGVAMSLLGLAGIVYCMVAVWRAKRAGLGDAALRARLQQVVAWNLGALGVSALGLGLLGVGIVLG